MSAQSRAVLRRPYRAFHFPGPSAPNNPYLSLLNLAVSMVKIAVECQAQEVSVTLAEIYKLILWALTTLGSAFLGSYLGAYLKKKGENQAIHEDLTNVLEQVSAVTTTTKTIEAKISDDVWRRQKHWELKRDVLFEVLRKFRAAEETLVFFDGLMGVHAENPEVTHFLKSSVEAGEKWLAASGEFEEAQSLLEAVCDQELVAASKRLRRHLRSVAVKIGNKEFEAYKQSREETQKLSLDFKGAIRKELDLLTQPSDVLS